MKLPFSYVVLRYMHDVFTREFVNVAVVVYCPRLKFLKMEGVKSLKRTLAFFPGIDRKNLYHTLRFLESRFVWLDKTRQENLSFDELDAASIAKSILPNDDSSLQWSALGGGVTENPEQVLQELFARMVTWHDIKRPVVRRTEEQVWQTFEAAFSNRDKSILPALQDRVLKSGSYEHRFDHTLQPQGGPLHLLLPLSFDLVEPSDIVDKAIQWNGRFSLLRKAVPNFKAYLLLGKPSTKTHEAAYNEAHEVLSYKEDLDRKLVPEEEASAFAEQFSTSVISSN